MAAAVDEVSKSEARAAHDRDIKALNSSGPAASWWSTWCDFHSLWSPGLPVLPLTPEKIRDVACMFKAGRYRSFPNYLSRAKEEHRLEGFEWHEALDFQFARSVRSVQRGIGPSRQSCPFDVLKLGELALPASSRALFSPSIVRTSACRIAPWNS